MLRSPPLTSNLRPGFGRPGGDLVFVAFHRAVRGDLGCPADPVQQVGGAAQGSSTRGTTGRSIGPPEPGSSAGPHSTRTRRGGVKRGRQPGLLRGRQPARVAARSRRGQRRGPARAPAAAPLLGGLGADAQRFGDLNWGDVLFEQCRSAEADLFSAGPSRGGQTATIRVPHNPGLDPDTPLTTGPNQTSALQSL